jgi:UDP-N-acetylglucosamine diphosphorylase / glucose-1-phosphate thymidylyltransferase / UDP-N-acetylgalactosamine diphosphorylase / glucosamine-1-phosphate N-acetyltransferase / galactosamine-1-phosphate N-acetyltransferase
MKAIILCAGKSTRTYPLTSICPKPLIKIANKNLLERNLDNLNGFIDEAILVVGYKKEMIIEYFGDSYKDIKLIYVEQKKQLGTGDAINCAKGYIKDRFIVFGGDNLFGRKDIENCLKHHYSILGKEVEDPEKFGILVTENNKLKQIIEKPKYLSFNLANTFFYVLDKSIFDINIQKIEREEYEFADIVSEFAKYHDIIVEKVEEYWIPIDYPWHVLEANEYFLSKIDKNDIQGKIEDNVIINGNVILGKGSIIKSGTYIEGNVLIGKDCVIGPNTYIRGNTTLGDGCKAGQAVEIKNSVLMDGAKVPHLSYVGDSIVGNNSNLGGGTMIANLRHDGKNVMTDIKGELVDSRRRKFGTIIGDNVHIGINTSIYPGRKIWPNKTTIPGEIIKKDII